jgi:hypothetical protein
MANSFEENDILQARLEGVNVTSGTRWNIVRYYRVLTNLDEEVSHLEWLNGFAASIGVRFGLQVLTKLSEDLRYDFCRLQRIAPTDSVFAISADGADVGGVASGTDQPDAACLVTFRTDQPSKRFLGRCYIPGLPDAAIVDGLLTTQFAEEMWDAWTAMRTSHEVEGYGEIELFHFSPTNFEQTDNVGQSAAPIISVEVDRIVRRQDRRDYKGRIPTTTGYTP